MPAARIPVETIAAALLVAGADDDQIRDSGGMARNIVAARRQATARAQAGVSAAVMAFLQRTLRAKR